MSNEPLRLEPVLKPDGTLGDLAAGREPLKPAAHHVPRRRTSRTRSRAPFPQLTEFSARPTLEAIQKHYRLHNGGHWFDPDTLRFFRTRFSGPIFTDYNPVGHEGDGADCLHYFVTSEKAGFGDDAGRAFTVRSYRPRAAEIGTVGEFLAYKTREQALSAARKAAYR